MQRRTWLKLGAASAVVLAVGGGALALIEPGLKNARLTASARTVLAAASRAMLEGSLPADAGARAQALEGLLSRLDALVGALPAHAQAELSQLLALLASAPGRLGLAGLRTAWPDASVADIQSALQGMRFSKLSLTQQAYHALHDLVGGAYFSDPSTWPQLGYPGPLKI